MSDQLWGTCRWCQRRKRVTKAEEPLLYTHDRPGGNFPCLGSGQDPREGSVRTAEKVSLVKPVVPIQLGEIKTNWARGKSNAEVVQELRDLIGRGPLDRPRPDLVDEFTITVGETGWGWEVAYAFLWLGAIAAGFAVGWWWRGR